MSSAAVAILEPQPHGGALNRGGGRRMTAAAKAISDARGELAECLDRLVAIRDAGYCKKCRRSKATADEVVRVALAIIKLSQVEHARPRKRKASTFNVRTTAAGDAQAERAPDAPAQAPTPTRDSGAGAPR